FLFAYESQLSLSTIADRLLKESKTETTTDLVDAVFVLGKGLIINFGDGKGALQFVNPEGVPQTGWIMQEYEATLIELIAWLSVAMPLFVRFEPILPRYTNMNFKE